jgi:hypothetical protein
MIFRSPFPDVTIPEVPLTPYIFQHALERADKPAPASASTPGSQA